jgi:hypothetical protein
MSASFYPWVAGRFKLNQLLHCPRKLGSPQPRPLGLAIAKGSIHSGSQGMAAHRVGLRQRNRAAWQSGGILRASARVGSSAQRRGHTRLPRVCRTQPHDRVPSAACRATCASSGVRDRAVRPQARGRQSALTPESCRKGSPGCAPARLPRGDQRPRSPRSKPQRWKALAPPAPIPPRWRGRLHRYSPKEIRTLR